MKIVVAIDSFKGCLSSLEAGLAVRNGVFRVYPDADVIVKPLADGGEGTTDALVRSLGGEYVKVDVCGPMLDRVEATYGMIPDEKLAIIEMASASGLTLVDEKKRNPWKATSFGVGQMINDAISRGCREFIIGIGGSATNDAGLGMLSALGFEFIDEEEEKVGITAENLCKIKTIDHKNVNDLLPECNFRIACDVNNPLCGENGATYIYGPQKGVLEKDKAILDLDIKHFAAITEDFVHIDNSHYPGAGAAGGIGFAFLSYLNGKLLPGVELIIDAIGLESDLLNADFVVTGEGCLDHQTSMGKAPVGVAKLAKKHGATVIGIAGAVSEDAGNCNENGIDAYFSIQQKITSFADAVDKNNAISNIENTTEQVFRLIRASGS